MTKEEKATALHLPEDDEERGGALYAPEDDEKRPVAPHLPKENRAVAPARKRKHDLTIPVRQTVRSSRDCSFR
jgi:hypothetical protein